MDAQNLAIVYLPLLFALYIFTKQLLHKLQNLPPTPLLSLPFLGHLHLLTKPLYRSLARISARHGPVLLLQFGSRRVLVVSSPSAAEDCLSKNDVIFANRPHLLAGKHFGNNYTSLAWSSYGDQWRNLRKISSIEILSTNKLQMLQGIRADEVRFTVRALNRASDERRLVNMKTVFFELTLNVMMRMIAGKRYYGENVGEAEEARRFREIVTDTLQLAGLSGMEDFVPVLRWLGIGGLEKGLAEVQRRRDVLMQELVDQERKRSRGGGSGGEGKMKTMIEMLLALQEKEPEYYTDVVIKSLMLVMLIAGTDTSAGTMEWTLSLLLNNPHVLIKARSEIDERIGHGRLVEEGDIGELPYLRCIIKETLRMYPAGPLLIPHKSSDQCMVGGFRVPAGTMLLVNAWAIHNDPKNWNNPTEFKPERFENKKNDDDFKLLSFGAGRRGCPGEALAMRTMVLGLGSLIQCFDWERPHDKELIDMSEGGGLSMPRAMPLMAYCRSRADDLISRI